jgi:hypothetical protein
MVQCSSFPAAQLRFTRTCVFPLQAALVPYLATPQPTSPGPSLYLPLSGRGHQHTAVRTVTTPIEITECVASDPEVAQRITMEPRLELRSITIVESSAPSQRSPAPRGGLCERPSSCGSHRSVML